MRTTITMTKDEWVAEGTRRFGSDQHQWAFVCPGCGHTQSVADFAPFKDNGATPDSARKECIGRYAGGKSWANDRQSKPGPCDYASYGLFNISPITVTDGDKQFSSFAFGPSEKVQK